MHRWRLWNTRAHYGLLAKVFHGLSAVLFTTMLVGGFWMAGYITGSRTLSLYMPHKQLGLLLLLGVVLRWLNRALTLSVKTRHHSQHQWLYLGLLLAPLSGWLMSSAAGHAPVLFGWKLYLLPYKHQAVAFWAAGCHLVVAMCMIVLIVSHVGGLVREYGQGRKRIWRMWI